MPELIQPLLALDLEKYGHGIWYFAGGAALFLLVGFAFGYFVWRRGLMQVIELEAENRQSAETIESLSKELLEEESRIESEQKKAKSGPGVD